MNYESFMLRTFCRYKVSYQQCKHFHKGSFKGTYERNETRRKYFSRMEFDRTIEIKPNVTCKSQKLFLKNNILQPCHTGAYHYMPKGLRALEKLVRVIDEELQSIGAQKMSMPTMIQASLWKKTGRWDTKELFKLQDRHEKEYCLGPTHEESITKLVSEYSHTLSAKRLPIMVYQITRKFRDEMAPKYGLLRGREFEMKDMYTFDTSVETAKDTYNLVCDTYCRIFERLGLKYVKVKGATGNIGGVLSHEYHLPAEIGEDSIYVCNSCGFGSNSELLEPNQLDSLSCPDCQGKLTQSAGIEVGHAFLLGTKYSQVLEAFYEDANGKQICQMGCYGLGISRILQAGVEVLSTDSEIRWPPLIAPYQICIIPQKKGHAYEKTFEAAEQLSDGLSEFPNLKNEVVIDDRTDLSIGRRVTSAKCNGYPYVIAAGKKALKSPPVYEVIDTRRDITEYLTLDQVMNKLSVLETVQVV